MTDDRAVIELTRDELVKLLDEEARQRGGMSARDMLRAYRSGQLDQTGEVADLLILGNLLPETDPLLPDAA
jgi:hypothetical protein